MQGYSPDILTYNILMCAKYRLGKLDQFHRLLDEMGRSGFSLDKPLHNNVVNFLFTLIPYYVVLLTCDKKKLEAFLYLGLIYPPDIFSSMWTSF